MLFFGQIHKKKASEKSKKGPQKSNCPVGCRCANAALLMCALPDARRQAAAAGRVGRSVRVADDLVCERTAQQHSAQSITTYYSCVYYCMVATYYSNSRYLLVGRYY